MFRVQLLLKCATQKLPRWLENYFKVIWGTPCTSHYGLQQLYSASNCSHACIHLTSYFSSPFEGGTEKGWVGWKFPRKRQNDRECFHRIFHVCWLVIKQSWQPFWSWRTLALTFQFFGAKGVRLQRALRYEFLKATFSKQQWLTKH